MEFQETGKKTIASVNKAVSASPAELIMETPMKPEILKEMSELVYGDF